jgi:hypothetical protein
LPPEKPFHVLRPHPVLIGKKPANPDTCGHGVFRRPDLFAFEIFRLFDAGFDVVVDGRMAKEARREDRNADEGRVSLTEHCDVV